LRNWPHKLAAFQQKNLKELRAVAWLDPNQNHLHLVPPALHCQMIAFLTATGLSQLQKLAVLEWMVRFGSPEGRLAATDVLKELDDDGVQDVVLESLDSNEPDVQAWATSQLRAWAIPNAMEMLVERLDSPIPEVRQAARGELAGFDVHRVLEILEHLEPRMQTAVGRLIQKIDPHTPQKLKGEMLNAIRSKRIRAGRAALVMNLHVEVADALLVMARDSDNLVRRTAAEVLGKVHSREAIEMLMELTGDSSPRVRETAAAALDEIKAARDPSSGESRGFQGGSAPLLETAP
jgi:HEAT repeat protein